MGYLKEQYHAVQELVIQSIYSVCNRRKGLNIIIFPEARRSPGGKSTLQLWRCYLEMRFQPDGTIRPAGKSFPILSTLIWLIFFFSHGNSPHSHLIIHLGVWCKECGLPSREDVSADL